jgi:hypothetical protein
MHSIFTKLYLYGSTVILLGLGRFLSFLILYTVGITYTPRQAFQEDEMDRACSTNGGEDECI